MSVIESVLLDNRAQAIGTGDVWNYIIVGGGVAGTVLARRLSEDLDIRVLLIEWGDNHDEERCVRLYDDSLNNAHDPLFANNFSCLANAQGADSRRPHFHQPRVLGGHSTLNRGFWARGGIGEWDEFGDRSGNPGFKYYKMVDNWVDLEKFNGPSEKPLQRGHHGFLDVMLPNNSHSWSGGAFSRAARQVLGVPVLEDYNNERPHGVARPQFNVTHDRQEGHLIRASMSSVMLPVSLVGSVHFAPPISNRPNLTIITGALVDRLIIEPVLPPASLQAGGPGAFMDPSAETLGEPSLQCQGVWYWHQGKAQFAMASTRVLLCAGPASALVLQRSGVGPDDLLRSLGIKTKIHNTHVGGNLYVPYGVALFLRAPVNAPMAAGATKGKFSSSSSSHHHHHQASKSKSGNHHHHLTEDDAWARDLLSGDDTSTTTVEREESSAAAAAAASSVSSWDADPIGTYIPAERNRHNAPKSHSVTPMAEAMGGDGNGESEEASDSDEENADEQSDEITLKIDRWLGLAFSSDPTKIDKQQKGNPRRRWFFELFKGAMKGTDENVAAPPSNVDFDPATALTLRLMNLDPVSRGRMDISKSDAPVPPRVNFNFYGDRSDLISNRELLRTGQRLARTMGCEVCWPPVSDDLDWQLRSNLAWLDQAGGTCRVGNSTDDGVVDGYLRVLGVGKLSVCDSSVFLFPMSPDQTAAVAGLAYQYAHFLQKHLDATRCCCGAGACGCCSVPCRFHPPAPAGSATASNMPLGGFTRVEPSAMNPRSNLWELNTPASLAQRQHQEQLRNQTRSGPPPKALAPIWEALSVSFTSPSAPKSAPPPSGAGGSGKTHNQNDNKNSSPSNDPPLVKTLSTAPAQPLLVTPRIRMDNGNGWGCEPSPSFAKNCERDCQSSSFPSSSSCPMGPPRNASVAPAPKCDFWLNPAPPDILNQRPPPSSINHQPRREATFSSSSSFFLPQTSDGNSLRPSISFHDSLPFP